MRIGTRVAWATIGVVLSALACGESDDSDEGSGASASADAGSGESGGSGGSGGSGASAAASCGDGQKGNCPNDEAPSADKIANCKSSTGGACASEVQAWYECFMPKVVCDAAGKSSVPDGSCPDEWSAVSTCAQAHPEDFPDVADDDDGDGEASVVGGGLMLGEECTVSSECPEFATCKDGTCQESDGSLICGGSDCSGDYNDPACGDVDRCYFDGCCTEG